MNKEIIKEYWLMALIDFDEGVSIKEMNKTLKLYEREEMYEACAGILKAIKQIKNERKNERKNKKISRI
tara:strand:+ start:615 stop:821 length:207 start_codon:yes stop_codon:yes gene_type:complete